MTGVSRSYRKRVAHAALAAPAASVDPHALKKVLPPPKVAVPKLRVGTRNPD
jgi:hypothetical protein